MFFEKSVTSFAVIESELGLLDLDSGIRTFGDYAGKKRQFVFVTRSPSEGYTLMVYSRKGSPSNPVPGDRLLVKEFSTKKSLAEFMRGLLSKPVKAFVY